MASLNHPHIASVYGVEENAIVMELVEGAELRGPIPLDQALPRPAGVGLGVRTFVKLAMSW